MNVAQEVVMEIKYRSEELEMGVIEKRPCRPREKLEVVLAGVEMAMEMAWFAYLDTASGEHARSYYLQWRQWKSLRNVLKTGLETMQESEEFLDLVKESTAARNARIKHQEGKEVSSG
jgi:hypothetical protein